jgi:endonuclease YncB( thermonuclease family)
VDHVIDGDTIVMEDGSKVRLLQINAPERGQCGYEEATDRLRELVEGQEVGLEKEDRFGDTDMYGRLLRYVHLKDEVVNVQLQQEGLVDAMFFENKHGKYAYRMTGEGSCAN